MTPILEELWQGQDVTDENIQIVSRRRSEAIMAFRKAKQYVPDCGFKGKPYHLSLAKALDTSQLLSVGMK